MADISDEDLEAAARYVRHDFSRKTIAEVLEEYGLKKPEAPGDGDPTPPPPSEEGKTSSAKKRRGLWWPSEEEKAEEAANG